MKIKSDPIRLSRVLYRRMGQHCVSHNIIICIWFSMCRLFILDIVSLRSSILVHFYPRYTGKIHSDRITIGCCINWCAHGSLSIHFCAPFRLLPVKCDGKKRKKSAAPALIEIPFHLDGTRARLCTHTHTHSNRDMEWNLIYSIFLCALFVYLSVSFLSLHSMTIYDRMQLVWVYLPSNWLHIRRADAQSGWINNKQFWKSTHTNGGKIIFKLF